MQLTESDISEFVKIWFVEFDETITDDAARLSASMLLDLCFLLASPESEEGE